VRFYLGTHETSWLERVDVPLFISHVRLRKRKRLPQARGQWALDSGGFTELSRHGGWRTTVTEYVEAVDRYGSEIGRLEWAAPMDWMCEPHMIENTGLTVREHQDRTVVNYLELRGRGPFIPVLQGWDEADYHYCADLYAAAGVDLTAEPLVGLGTVCRRQGTAEIRRVVSGLAERGLSLHGFGVKRLGLPAIAHLVESADSMAWSSRGRMAWQHDDLQLCGGAGDHRGSCANCQAWALRWRGNLIDRLGLFGDVAA
jgi:hypothetical protein